MEGSCECGDESRSSAMEFILLSIFKDFTQIV
jgi:hypothetical protein